LTLSASKQQEHVNLTWKTIWEANTQTCVIERSTNGQTFTRIAEMPAVGNSNNGHQYYFIDRNVPAGSLYYRIRVMDKDDKSLTSNIAVVSSNIAVATTVYPNPVHKQLYITLPQKGLYQVHLMNTAGQTVYSQTVDGSQGGATHAITRKHWPAGVYRLVIADTSGKTGSSAFNVMFD